MGFNESVSALLLTYDNCLALLKAFKRQKKQDGTRKTTKTSERQALLRHSLRTDRRKVERAYSSRVSVAGSRFEKGDSKARSALDKVLKRLNAAIKSLIRLASKGPNPALDYQSLTSLSNSSRLQAIKAFDQLSHRLDSRASQGSVASATTNSELSRSSRSSKSSNATSSTTKSSGASRSSRSKTSSSTRTSPLPGQTTKRKSIQAAKKTEETNKNNNNNPHRHHHHHHHHHHQQQQQQQHNNHNGNNDNSPSLAAAVPRRRPTEAPLPPLPPLAPRLEPSLQTPLLDAMERRDSGGGVPLGRRLSNMTNRFSLISASSDSTRLGEIPDRRWRRALLDDLAEGSNEYYSAPVVYPLKPYQPTVKERKFLGLFRRGN